MNFVFISPNFPKTYWNFCDRLQKNGVRVLGIGDAPYEELLPELKASLTEYYRVGNLPITMQWCARWGISPIVTAR